MKIAVWSTGHSIADTIARAVESGLPNAKLYNTIETLDEDFSGELPEADIHIAYGILRGTAEVFRKAGKAGKPWFNVDRGYIGANHYDGYYRISLRGTQQTLGLDQLEPDYERLDLLNIDLLPPKLDGLTVIICPPTEYVKGFFDDIDDDKWINKAIQHVKQLGYSDYKVRTKENSLHDAEHDDFPVCALSYTFNCSLGWKWLARGVQVISDPDHSIVGAYQKTLDGTQLLDLDSRRKLFGIQASLQLTLNEMRNGLLWPLLHKLLSLQNH
jgi:hypothetical protein